MIDFTRVSKRTLNAILDGSRFSVRNKAALLDGTSIPVLVLTHGITGVAIYRMLRTIKDHISPIGEVSADDWFSGKIDLRQVIAPELHFWASQIKHTFSTRVAASTCHGQTALLMSRSAVIAGK